MLKKPMRYRYHCFLASIIQFTRVPIKNDQLDARHFAESLSYFPLIGLFLGSIGYILTIILLSYFSSTLSIIITLICLTLITGALHEDGFADCCDGFFGGSNQKACLDIMKDSRLGTYGTLGLIFLITFKLIVLSELSIELLPIAWITVQSLSRLPAVMITINSKYAHMDRGSSKMTADIQPSLVHILPVCIIILLFNILLLPVTFIALSLFIVVIFSYFCIIYFNKKISGYNGDCLGASQQATECLLLTQFVIYF